MLTTVSRLKQIKPWTEHSVGQAGKMYVCVYMCVCKLTYLQKSLNLKGLTCCLLVVVSRPHYAAPLRVTHTS